MKLKLTEKLDHLIVEIRAKREGGFFFSRSKFLRLGTQQKGGSED